MDCSHCGFPIHGSASGLRHYGTHIAHQENECLRLLMADRGRLRAEVESLRGVTPELPPRPPDGGGLPRYGLRHNSQSMPMSVPMDDGYWTPHHLAIAQVEALRADAERLDCGQIMIDTRDEFGEPKQVWHTGMNLRAAIDAAREAYGEQGDNT